MSEEGTPVEVPTTTESAAVDQQPTNTTAETASASVATTPSLEELLEKADSKELRKHPKIAGMFGSELQRAIQEYEHRKKVEGSDSRREETEGEMLRLFEDNAEYVKQHYPKAYERYTEMQQERAARELDGIKGKTVNQVGLAIGRALADVPEWQKVTAQDKEKLASMVVGKSDDEALAIFNREAWNLVAEIRAKDRHEGWKSKDLVKEREVIRQEEAAKLLATTEAPGNGRPPKGTPAGISIAEMSPEDFDRYWENLKTQH